MDANNILSLLALQNSLSSPMSGQMPPDVPVTYQPPPPVDQPISNVLQAVQAPVAAAPPPPPPPPPPVPTPAAAPEEPPRKRRSVIETIGRLADVFAKVGGAEALYEPTLNARADRLTQVDLDKLKLALGKQAITAGEQEIGAAERKRIGTALGALAGRENAAALWPSIAEQAAIDPQKAAAIGQIIQANPDAAGIFARSLGADLDNLGKNVYFGTDAQGKTVAYQVGPTGKPTLLDFGDSGITPSDPTKIVNLGGTTAVLDSRGNPRRILPNTEAPGRAADRASRERIAAMRPGGAKAGGADPAMVETAQASLNELRQIYGTLNEMGAIVSENRSSTANAAARARSSLVGQTLEGTVGTKAQTQRDRIASIRPGLMQALAKATGMTGRQLDSNADVKLFMQTVTDPTRSYEANIAAINGLERFLKANAKKAAPAKVTPQSNTGGWSIVEVK